MKKKGLIVATIVMVLVLAVSLTTATYAWFTAQGETTIEDIKITAANTGEVLLGLTTTGSIVADPDDTKFVSGSITAVKNGTNSTWAGDAGMSVSVDTMLELTGIAQAVSTSSTEAPDTLGTAWAGTADADNKQLTGSYFVKASGQGTTLDTKTVAPAEENKDYLHFTVGLLATKENIDTITLTITIKGGSVNGTIMGVTNALHLIYKVNDDASWTNLDVGGNNSHTKKIEEHFVYYKNGELQANKYEDAEHVTQEAGTTVIQIVLGTPGGAPIGTAAENIQQIEIYLYYVGTDSHCVTAGLGTTADVSFAVTNTNDAVVPQE